MRRAPYSSPSLARRARRFARDRAESARLPQQLQAINAQRLLQPMSPPPGARLAPAPGRSVPLLGHVFAFGAGGQRRMHDILRLREDLGDVIRFHLGGVTAHLVSDPELIREVLQEKHRLYTKNTRGIYKLRMVLGNGLVTSQGPSWFRNRRIAQPAFHKRRIGAFAETMLEATTDLQRAWSSGQVIDAHEAMMEVTLQIIAKTMLSLDVSDITESVGKAVAVLSEDVNHRLNSPIEISPLVPTGRNIAFRKAMEELDHIVLDTIESRRRKPPQNNDLLDMFINAEDAETGERMNDAQLRDEVMTVFIAGHETTANALSWTFYLLSRHSDWADKARAEARAAFQSGETGAALLPKLPLLKRIIQESMRLYPPVWMTARAPSEDTELGGYYIPKDSLVLASPWAMGRHPDHWQNPEAFDPDRFLPERSESRHRFAHFPFGGGPRICIGNNFAMMEAQLIAAALLKDWNLELIPGHPVELDPQVTLRPKHGLAMRLRRMK